MRGVGEGKNIFGILQALIRSRWICAAVKLITQCEIRHQTAREIWTDRRSRGTGHEHRTIADKERCVRIARFRISSLAESIGRLRQSPDVVFGDQAVRSGIASAAVAGGRTGIAFAVIIPVLAVIHLVVQGSRPIIPHLHQPVDSELRFIAEVG